MKSSSFGTKGIPLHISLDLRKVLSPFHSLFALPAGMSEQGPLLQGRRTQCVPCGGRRLPWVEGDGLRLPLRQTLVRICGSLSSGEAVSNVRALPAEAVYCGPRAHTPPPPPPPPFLLKPSVPPDEVKQNLYQKVFHFIRSSVLLR